MTADGSALRDTEREDTRRTAGRRPWTRTLWDKVCEGYRLAGCNHAAVGVFAGVDKRTARDAYERGVRKIGVPKTPIRQVIWEEARAARELELQSKRAQTAQEQAEELRRAQERQKAIEEERELMERSRKACKYGLELAVRATETMLQIDKGLAAYFGPGLVEGGKTIKADLTDPEVFRLALQLRRDWGLTSARLTKAAETIVKLGRLDRGEATERVDTMEGWSDEQLEEEILAVGSLAEDVKAKKVDLRVLPGGKGSSESLVEESDASQDEP